MDFTSGIAVTNTGHCHPRVVAAIQEQAAKIIHAQQNIFAHEPMMKAAVELTSTLPATLNQVFWANSGAEAIEGAIKLAKVADAPARGHRHPRCIPRSHPRRDVGDLVPRQGSRALRAVAGQHVLRAVSIPLPQARTAACRRCRL